MPFVVSSSSIARALEAQGYAEPTAVQAAVLEQGGAEADLLVSAQTGSGKTVAFGLAIASTLLGDSEFFGDPGAPLAIIIAPTRELALQVQRELDWLYNSARARVVSCVGGMDPRAERRALNNGCHIVVGTPGRLRDHLERGALDVASLRVAVLDEADEMLDLGFREDLEFLLDAMPAERRTLLFSATIPREIAAMAKRFQRDAFRIDTIGETRAHADISYLAVRVAPSDVEHAVVNLLRFHDQTAAIVFCATREAVNRLHASLAERGFAAVALSGEFTQNERNHALQALRDGRARVCVATDVAARGLDLPDLGLVVHVDLPRNRDTLLHRSGRTGRAGKKGLCAVIVPYTKRRLAERLFHAARVNPEWIDPPTPEAIRAQDRARLLEHPSFAETPTDDDTALAAALIERRTPQEIATALARFFRDQLPAPEDLLDAPQQRDTRGPRDARESRFDARNDERGPPRDRGPREPMDWFRINAGRNLNADPRWLIPLICRLGHITKREIGSIKVFDKDTKFEILTAAASSFMRAVNDANDPEVRITPTAGPTGADRAREGHGARAPRGDGPRSDGPRPPRAPRPDHGEGRSRDERPHKPRSSYNPAAFRELIDAPAAPPRDERPRHEDRPARPDRPPQADRPGKPFAPKGDFKAKGKPPYKGKPEAGKPPFAKDGFKKKSSRPPKHLRNKGKA
ncbi:MAG: DEAD/DEAH box helicase [Micropepsaceae bacterium]